MAQKYYDSVFTGAQIDAAVRSASAIASASIPGNQGKFLSIDESGNIIPVDAPSGYDDTEISNRVSFLENAINGLIPASGEAF